MEWQPLDFRGARVRARLTQKQLGKLAGCSQSLISKFESGNRTLSQDQVLLIARLIVERQEALRKGE